MTVGVTIKVIDGVQEGRGAALTDDDGDDDGDLDVDVDVDPDTNLDANADADAERGVGRSIALSNLERQQDVEHFSLNCE